MILAIRPRKAISTYHRITLLIIFSAWTLISPAVILPAVAAPLPEGTFLITETLRNTEITFATATPFTPSVHYSLP